MSHIHIYAPDVLEKKAVAGTCPDCGQRTRFLTFCYEWYGPDSTCIKCGRGFCEGEWVPLPFVRGSRQKQIANVKERFRRTKAISRDHILEEFA